jgi:hypothetical protein
MHTHAQIHCTHRALAGLILFNSVACLKTKPSFAIAKQSSTRENQSTITTKVDTIINPAITKNFTFPNIILAAAALWLLANMIPLLKASLALGERDGNAK